MIYCKKSRLIFLAIACILLQTTQIASAQIKAINARLPRLQQAFVDLKFGMFIHYNIPTYMNQDWADPEASPSLFNPQKLDCNQWAQAAKSAHMSYGCLTTKHHSGFSIWDTKTTPYNVMNSPLKRDVVKEFTEAFRRAGLKVMLYYSILDTHHKLRPNAITPAHIKMVKEQITELLTRYGKIEALIIDGWDAPWSRISYDEIPFEEIYLLVKKLQPDCLVMDLNGAKYPAEGMFYTDIKTYEMGAGQKVQEDKNRMPALACLPINSSWFWKEDFPTTKVKQPSNLVNDLIIPLNKANCNFILNVAPNKDGLIDDNELESLKQVGTLWNNNGSSTTLPQLDAPVISHNLATGKPSNSSWSDDMNIMDFANDDRYTTSWVSNPTVKNPWYEIDLKSVTAFNAISITESRSNITRYRIEYFSNNSWKTVVDGDISKNVKVHRFPQVTGSKIRIHILDSQQQVSIAEIGIYKEKI